MTRWIIVLSMLGLAAAAPAALEPDLAFGDDGRVTQVASGPTDEAIVAMAVDPQDRVVSAYSGISGRGVSRHLADGSLDVGFGVDGRVVLDFQPRDLVIQADGRIAVVGGDTGPLLEQDWRVACLMPDGTLDSGYGTDGEIELDWFGSGDEALSAALAADGSLVVGGRAFDPSAGTAFAVAIFDTQGTRQFWRATKLAAGTADICNRVLVQDDGKIICAGLIRNFSNAVMVVLRYESDLDFDTDFGTDGLAVVTFPEGPAEAQHAVLLSGGEILLGGFVDDADDWALALARLTSAGALDTSFSTDGMAMTQLPGSDTESIRGLLPDGNRILATVFDQDRPDFLVAGFTSDGALDATYGQSGLAEIDFNGLVDASSAIVGHQGQVLVGGGAAAQQRAARIDLGLVRLDGEGALDPAFSGDGRRQDGLSGPVTAWTTDAVRRDDGGVVTVGYVGPSFDSREVLVTAFNANGSPDTAFGEQGSVTADFDNGMDEARAVARLADGRLLVAGVVRPDPGTDDIALARFLADGSLDTSFGDQGWAVVDLDGNTDAARDLVVQPDGKILVGGDGTFPSHGFTHDFAVVRFNADGTLDAAFGVGGVARLSVDTFDEAAAISLQANGQIILGGSSDGDYVVARFDSDGSLDTDFGTDGIVVYDFLGQFDFMRDLLVIDDWDGQGERILAVGMARNGGSSPLDEDFAAVMMDADGLLETGFGSGGQVVRDISGGQDQAASVVVAASNLVLAGRVGSPQDFGAWALTSAGADAAGYFAGGAVFTADFAGSSDEVLAVLADGEALLLAGQSFHPEELGGIQKIALLRLAVSERIFSDSFEQP